jgi:hypothetical protein
MANAIQAASTRRKLIYLGVIAGLFTVTLFWRGTIPMPLGNPGQPLAAVADNAILAKAKTLELRELELGDPDIIGTATLVTLSGARGVVVSGLWRAAIEKQKKNEFGELENLVRIVTRLQPNFRVPWLFQSWNLAYNVSVENERLNDMYFYIYRGIELLAEGERLNRKSPDMRHSLAFYYQNKFGVSDKVNTLRSLMQLSCIPAADRDPRRYQNDDKTINAKAFEEFCQKNPQFVRRLREKLACNLPEQVVQFLKDNSKIPSRYDLKTGELLEPELQFPILPISPGTIADPDERLAYEKYLTFKEYDGATSEFDDRFDAFHAARAWFQYAQVPLPPPPKDDLGQPLPTGVMSLEGTDRFRYRLPKSPALILFRNGPARAQTYLAERLMKEGWYDAEIVWRPDEFRDSASHWFKANPNVGFKASDNAQSQWDLSYRAWDSYGKENAMTLTQARMEELQRLAAKVEPNSPALNMPREMLASVGRSYAEVQARKALDDLEKNLRVTNFYRFISVSQAEMQPTTIEARKLFGEAQQQQSQAEYQKALPLYVRAMNLWRQVMINNPRFHRADQTREGEEEMYETLMKMADLQAKELEIGDSKRRFDAFASGATGLFGGVGGHEGLPDLKRTFAEDEVLTRVTELDGQVQQRIADVTGAIDAAFSPIAMQADAARRTAPIRAAIGRGIVNGEFAWLREFKEKGNFNEPWVTPYTIDSIRQRLNLVRKLPPPTPADGTDPTAPPVPQKLPVDMPKAAP